MSVERNRAWRRKKDYSKGRRKKNIGTSIGWYYKHDGQYIKGKIHCSCPMCSSKTNSCGYKHSDKRKVDSMCYRIAEYRKED